MNRSYFWCWVALSSLGAAYSAAASISTDYGKIALSFEPNRGQAPRSIEYLARGAGYTVAIQPGAVFFNLRGKDQRKKSSPIGLHFQGSSARPSLTASDTLPGTVNYFLGSKPSGWHSAIPTFGKVEYRGVYPGIDAVFYGTQRRLEYDWIVAPGSDPARIRVTVSGTGALQLRPNGDLALGNDANSLQQSKPVVYQMDAAGRREPVEARYVLLDRSTFGFRVAAYDQSRPLVIDPVLSYATFLGGSGSDGVANIQVDSSGNAYITGFSTSTNFPRLGGVQSTNKGAPTPSDKLTLLGDAFVAKLNATGTALIFSTYLGGSDDDVGVSLAVDPSGNIYVAGNTRSSDFPVTTGALQTKFGGVVSNDFYNAGDAFVVKLNPSGSQLLYSTYLGGTQNEMAWGIAVDASGVATVAGCTQSTNFPVKNAAFSTYHGGQGFGEINAGDAFLAKLDATGASLVFSTYLGGAGHDMIKGLFNDSQGNSYVTGFTYSPDFPVTSGAYQTTFRGAIGSNSTPSVADAFVAKFSSQGALIYATYLGGSNDDVAWAIVADSSGNAIVTGNSTSTNFPVTAGALRGTFQGNTPVGEPIQVMAGDAFVTKLNATGTALIYSTYLGGSADDVGSGIALDPAGNTLVTGFTLSSQFPVSADALQSSFGGLGGQGGTGLGQDGQGNENTGDAFLTKLSPAGALIYSSYYGGSGDDAAMTVAVDAAGNAYMAGGTLSSALHTTSGAVQATYGGTGALFPRGDGFVTKFDFGGTLPATPAGVTAVPGFPTTGNAGATLTPAFTVEVVDGKGLKLAGVTVAFTASGASVNPASATTDAQGRAASVVTLGATAGTATVTATVAGLPAVTANVTVVIAPAGGTITSVNTAGSPVSAGIAGNTFIEIKGINLVPATTPSTGVIWSNAPEFQQGKMPTNLQGISVTVNGKPAYIYFYCSAVTSACAADQVNALTGLETLSGNAQIVVLNNGVPSATFAVVAKPVVPSLLLFNAQGYVAATHLNFTLLGPTTLYPGASTPAAPGEQVVLYAVGFGPPTNTLTEGSSTQSGSLATLPICKIGANTAQVSFAGVIAPGLYQLNITVPNPQPPAPGDNSISCTYNGASTESGALLTVK